MLQQIISTPMLGHILQKHYNLEATKNLMLPSKPLLVDYSFGY
jgi:hypothetical protein